MTCDCAQFGTFMGAPRACGICRNIPTSPYDASYAAEGFFPADVSVLCYLADEFERVQGVTNSEWARQARHLARRIQNILRETP